MTYIFNFTQYARVYLEFNILIKKCSRFYVPNSSTSTIIRYFSKKVFFLSGKDHV